MKTLETFLHLEKHPLPVPPDEWWFGLRYRSDLPWARLFAKQPQFEKYVHWESVSRLELMKLAYMAPAIFEKRFPRSSQWNLYAFLTPAEKVSLLSDLPQLEYCVDWNELNDEWQIENWMMLLSCQPQFAKYFDWGLVEKKPSPYWEHLLRRQPQFSGHCDFVKLEDWQIRRIKDKQPQLFEEDCQ